MLSWILSYNQSLWSSVIYLITNLQYQKKKYKLTIQALGKLQFIKTKNKNEWAVEMKEEPCMEMIRFFSEHVADRISCVR